MKMPDTPFRVEYEITGVCNLNCIYCYAKPFSFYVPPFDEVKHIITKTRYEADPFDFVLLGGESFTRKDILEIFELVTDLYKGRRFGASSNGTLLSTLSEEQLSRLKNYVNEGFSLQISLDSIDKKINDVVRGKTEKTLEGFKTLKEHNIPFSLGITMTKYNVNDITNSIEILIKDNYPVNSINLEILQPTITLGKAYFDIKLDRSLSEKVYYDVQKLIADLGRKDIEINGPIDESCAKFNYAEQAVDSLNIKTCLAGFTRAAILPNGIVTPCTTIRTINLGDLNKESWTDIWQRATERFLKLNTVTNSVSNQCSINLSIRKEEIDNFIAMFRKEEREKKPTKNAN